MQKKGQIFLLIIFIIFVASAIYYFRSIKTSDDTTIDGNIVKDLGNRIGFEGVRDPVDTTKSEFSFKGGPGRSLKATFNDWQADLHIQEGNIIGFEGTINTNSINTNMARLTKDLKKETLLNTNEYPQIRFISTDLSDGILTGRITFLGKTKEINFPVQITDDSISANFILDMEPFEIKDNRAKTVRVIFEFFK